MASLDDTDEWEPLVSDHTMPQTSPPPGGVLTPPQPAPPRQVLAEVREETRAGWFRRQVEGLPDWARALVLLAIAGMVFAGMVFYLLVTNQRPTVVMVENKIPEQPAPVVQMPPVSASPQPVEGRAGPGKRLLGAIARNRVSAELQRDGFASVGGDPTPLTREQADRVAAKLDDATISAAGELYGFRADDDRPVLDFLRDLLQWLKDNEELIRFLLSLLMFL